jgi:iron(III) transport system ATP-binding protein
LSSRVLDVVYYGHDAVLRLAVDLGGPEPTEVPVRTPGHDLPQRGEQVRLAVDGPVIAYPIAAGNGHRATTGSRRDGKRRSL